MLAPLVPVLVVAAGFEVSTWSCSAFGASVADLVGLHHHHLVAPKPAVAITAAATAAARVATSTRRLGRGAR